MRDVALSDTAMPIENFVIECEVARFLINQFAKNVVRIQAGGSTLMFLKMPDGTYLPPMGAHAKSKLELLGTAPSQFFQYTSPDKVVYKYKTTGEIETITYPFGITITFTYTSGRLTKVSNGFRDLNFTYDTFGQLLTVNDGNGRTVTLTIPSTGTLAGHLTAVKDPLNKTTTYNYQPRGLLTQVFKPANPSSPIFTNTYDSLYRVMEQTDAYNNLWQFFVAGTRSEEVAPNGANRIIYFNDKGSPIRNINALGQEVTTEYDGNQRIILQTAPEGNSVATTYDANGNTLTTTNHAKPGSGLTDRTVSYTYETTWNKVATVTNPAGNTTSYEYFPQGVDGASLTKKITEPTVAAGTPETKFEYNNIGQLTKTTDPTLVVTVKTYESAPNKRNLLSETVDPSPGLNIQTENTYDSVGNILTTTDPKGNVTTAVYDVLRRVTQITRSAPFNQVSNITYDDNGNVIQVQSLPAADSNSQINQGIYGIDGKILSVTGPVNFGQGAQPVPTRYEYDSLRRLIKVATSLGDVVTMEYDALSRLYRNAVNGMIRETFAYTANGQILSITDARSNTTVYQYDGFDRVSRVTYPDSSSEQVVEYDNRSNIIEAITRGGDTFEFTYDAANQLQKKTPAGLPEVSFTYDLAGRTLTASTLQIPGDPSTGIFGLGYDTAGRLVQEVYPDGKTVIMQLDKNGNVLELTYPDGTKVTSSFDQLNRPTAISGFGGSVALTYDLASRRVSQVNGNNTGQGYWYDKDDGLLSMTIGGLKANLSLPMERRVDFAYGLSDASQQMNRRCSDPNFIWQPVVLSTITYATANNINQYSSVGGLAFSYDGNGCLTSDGIKSYAYDAESNLSSVTDPNGTVSFKYDPLGRLAQKIVGSTMVRYLYAGMQRIEEYDGDTLLRRYVYGTGLDECLFVVDATTGSITYLHADETGSVILKTDVNGMPIERNVYTPWGELTSGSLSSISVGFTGQFFDQDADLYFYKARFYSAKLGRFMQPDPIGYEGGLNLYEYCGSDPINFSDPLGLNPVLVPQQGMYDYSGGDDAVTLTGGVSTTGGPQFAGISTHGLLPGSPGTTVQLGFLTWTYPQLPTRPVLPPPRDLVAEQQKQAAEILAQRAREEAEKRAAYKRLLGSAVNDNNLPAAAGLGPFLALGGRAITRGRGGSATVPTSLLKGGIYLHLPTKYMGKAWEFLQRFAGHGLPAKEFLMLPIPNAKANDLLLRIKETLAIGAKGLSTTGEKPNIRWPISIKEWNKMGLDKIWGKHPGASSFFLLDLGAELLYRSWYRKTDG
jgi:RHS repeat-associated protein